jgi:hypothetical protein
MEWYGPAAMFKKNGNDNDKMEWYGTAAIIKKNG